MSRGVAKAATLNNFVLELDQKPIGFLEVLHQDSSFSDEVVVILGTDMACSKGYECLLMPFCMIDWDVLLISTKSLLC